MLQITYDVVPTGTIDKHRNFCIRHVQIPMIYNQMFDPISTHETGWREVMLLSEFRIRHWRSNQLQTVLFSLRYIKPVRKGYKDVYRRSTKRERSITLSLLPMPDLPQYTRAQSVGQGGHIRGRVISAPFGLPVDPDVRAAYMGLSEETGIVSEARLVISSYFATPVRPTETTTVAPLISQPIFCSRSIEYHERPVELQSLVDFQQHFFGGIGKRVIPGINPGYGAQRSALSVDETVLLCAGEIAITAGDDCAPVYTFCWTIIPMQLLTLSGNTVLQLPLLLAGCKTCHK
ncbi:hypothetical protein BDV33DRAFT_197560 [Aspergillus novoparasiticus]|uniref:Uncharacterized protein n=1 Tax=Aspergillus novoparasiticus TaxID=986946 RepID=A0A5N6F9L7_9EURO|nr:hypothetical protein BDV33DRAFT_197560 [Aspergillus novoparasiticus]